MEKRWTGNYLDFLSFMHLKHQHKKRMDGKKRVRFENLDGGSK
jgi:hypothetical protein